MLKKIALSLCFTLFLGLLSACSPGETLHLSKTESTPTNTPENIDRTNAPGSIGAPIALPPRFENEPLKPGQTKPELMPNGLPALSPMKGINYDSLFAEKIRDEDERFNRVENAVLDLRKEFETYKPAIVRLAAVESDIQNLIKELEVLLQETPSQQPPPDLTGGGADAEGQKTPEAVMDIRQLNPQPAAPSKPASAGQIPKAPTTAQEKSPEPGPKASASQPKTPQRQPAPLKDYGGRSVAMNFRIGEHDGVLRIAFDTNTDTPFTAELDNDEHLIIIELPQASWEGPAQRSFPDSALLDSLSVEPINGDKGSMIILSLKKDTQILQRKHLSPDKTTNYHRVYFDLKL